MFNLSKFYDNFYYFRKLFFEALFYVLDFFHVRFYLIFLLGGNLFIWLLTYFINVNVSQNLVVLHYNVDFGVNLIGDVKRIFIIPILSLIIILINTFLLFALGKHQDFKMISHLLLASCLVINLILISALFSIYLINFR